MWASSLLLLVLSQSPPSEEVCVPDEGGTGWTCGTNAEALSSGAVPARRERSMPPLLLIDPRRFDEGFDDSSEPLTPPASAVKQSPSAPVATAPVSVRLATQRAAPASTGGRFSVQLAATSKPDKFPALLRKLGLDSAKARTVRLSDQVWLLLYGDFPDAASARAAIPKDATGAWARDLATLAK